MARAGTQPNSDLAHAMVTGGMNDSISDVHVLTPRATTLDAPCVAHLKQQVDGLAEKGARRFVVDCTRIEAETPQGVSALVELGQRRGPVTLALAGLPKLLLQSAIDTALADYFAIFDSCDAARAGLRERNT